jgi:hypothetical protein
MGSTAKGEGMTTLYDLLSFRTLVTPAVLLWVYYLGALGMPLAAWLLARRVQRVWHGSSEENPEAGASAGRYRWRLRLLFFLFFLMGELAWRIFIEFFVAYFQIRDALVG